MNVLVDSTAFCAHTKLLLNILKSADIGQTDMLDCFLYASKSEKTGKASLLAMVERHGIIARFRLPAEVTEPGQATVDIHLLMDFTRKNTPVQFTRDDENSLKYTCGPISGSVTLSEEMEISELPKLEPILQCNVGSLAAAIKSVTFKPYMDEDRQHTILESIEGGRFEARTFDSLRAAITGVTPLKLFRVARLQSETKLLKAVTALVDGDDENEVATLYGSDIHARLKTPRVEIQWPNTQMDITDSVTELDALREQECPTASFSYAELESVSKSVVKIATSSTGAREADIKFFIEAGKVSVSARSSIGTAHGNLAAKSKGTGSAYVKSPHFSEFLTLIKGLNKDATIHSKITSDGHLFMQTGASTFFLVGSQEE